MTQPRDLADAETCEMQGSGAKPYVLKNTGGVYSCSCPAWRNQSHPIERRTCKHLRKLRGDAAESARIGSAAAAPVARGVRAEASAPRTAQVKEGAPPVLLAHAYSEIVPAIDPTGWWMSEKLDGVRAWWNGRRFLSRRGNTYHAPAWFAEGLPDFPLDGELWLARKQFQRCVAIVRRQDANELWKQVRYVVFDAPANEAPFEERLQHCREVIARAKPTYASAHPHEPCVGAGHLREELARIEALGGEGLMLRQPGSRYVAGRSTTLLKVKSFLDAEATVIGHSPGLGRHQGRLGALEVELANGKRFSVGTGLSDAERENPPAIGTLITFRYQELSSDGIPRFPSYTGVCTDAV